MVIIPIQTFPIDETIAFLLVTKERLGVNDNQIVMSRLDFEDQFAVTLRLTPPKSCTVPYAIYRERMRRTGPAILSRNA